MAGETGYPALHVGGAEQGIGWVHDQLWQKFLPAETAIPRFSCPRIRGLLNLPASLPFAPHRITLSCHERRMSGKAQ
jgi:hypothetical protein